MKELFGFEKVQEVIILRMTDEIPMEKAPQVLETVEILLYSTQKVPWQLISDQAPEH